MPLRRLIDWSSVRRDFAVERAPAPAPLTACDRFDVAAIMRKAVRLARSTFRTCGTWTRRMAFSLRGAWSRAKAERGAAADSSTRRAPSRVPAGILAAAPAGRIGLALR